MSTYKLGERSLQKFYTLDGRLQNLVLEILRHQDCTVLCGYRGEALQEKAFSEGNSRLHFPDSMHNKQPSLAMDLVPYPMPKWEDIQAFRDFGFFVMGVAAAMDIPLRWGADWNKNYKVEKGENDFPHFEIVTAPTNKQ